MTPEPLLTTDHPTRQCVDLRQTFGTTYRYHWDPSYHAETPAGRKVEQAWLTTIPCKHGSIAPHGGRRLSAYCDAGPVKRRAVERLGCVAVSQGGGECPEIIVTFDVNDIEQVAEVLKARRPRVYSPGEQAKRRKRLAEARATRKGSKSVDTDRGSRAWKVRPKAPGDSGSSGPAVVEIGAEKSLCIKETVPAE